MLPSRRGLAAPLTAGPTEPFDRVAPSLALPLRVFPPLERLLRAASGDQVAVVRAERNEGIVELGFPVASP
jgi:hypothetical protein